MSNIDRYKIDAEGYMIDSPDGQWVDYEDYAELQQTLDAMAAESDTNLRSAASELNTSWMLHKTMMGAQAALLCLSQGDILSAKEWLEGTTDEAIIDMPDNLNPGDLQAWFDSHMVSNGGTNGFLTHNEALELLRKRAPATASYLNSVRAEVIPEGYILVPQQMHISADAMESICFHGGDGDGQFGEFTDVILWVGHIENDDGTKTYGLNITTAEYPEDGSANISEFAEPIGSVTHDTADKAG